MGFYDKLKEVLDNRKTLTENGAVAFETSGSALVDMNFKVASYRRKEEKEILGDFLKAYTEDPELAVKWMFYAGDVREGLGERRLFKILVKNVLPAHPELVKYIAEYSRFDILMELFDTPAEKIMLEFVSAQLASDIANMAAGKGVSLLGKWLPSVNTSSPKTRVLAHRLCKALDYKPGDYRKTLSALRKVIDVTEVKMCAKEWDKIDYQKVPSKANLNYNSAFLKNDEARRREFLSKLVKGEVKVNAGAIFPHEIVTKYRKDAHYQFDSNLEGAWKNLPARDASKKPMIVVRDGSGSMEYKVDPKSGTTALDIATALSVYFSEHTSEAYADKFITFSTKPQLVDLHGLPNLASKLKTVESYDECSNTNIEAVFDLILDVAVKNHAKQEDIPEILVISDMEFDGCACSNATAKRYGGCSGSMNKTLFENIEKRWNARGYQLPGLVFWNINSRTNAVPIQQNALGVKLVSGFSPNVLGVVMSDQKMALDALKEVLLSDRYKKIVIG